MTTNKRKILIIFSAALIAAIFTWIILFWPQETAPPIEKPEIPALPSSTPYQVIWPTAPPLTPTPTPSPTLTPTPTPTPTLTPTPIIIGGGGGNGGGGGGGGGGGTPTPTPKPTPPPTITPSPTPTPESQGQGVLVCDADGSNCTKTAIGLNFSNIRPGESRTEMKAVRNNQSQGGKLCVQVNIVGGDLEKLSDFLYFEVVSEQQRTISRIVDFEEPVQIGNIAAEQILPINITWKLLGTAGNDCQGEKARFDVVFSRKS